MLGLTIALALASARVTVNDYEWIAVAPADDGSLLLVAAKPIVVGSCYGGCYIRVIQRGDEVLEWSCPDTLACASVCAERERHYDAYDLIYCDCPPQEGGHR